MQMAIEASLKEKQREDRRRTRGTRAEEEDQDRPMEECRDMAAVGETEGDKERDLDFDEVTEEVMVKFISCRVVYVHAWAGEVESHSKVDSPPHKFLEITQKFHSSISIPDHDSVFIP